MDKTHSKVARIVFILLAAAACVTAQAGNQITDDKIAVAKAAIDQAEQAGGPDAAPVEMASARDKLARASKAVADHDSARAGAWADQASIDAQVAQATAAQRRSRKAAEEFDAGLQTLRQEANRASQSPQ